MLYKRTTVVVALKFQDSNIINFRGRELVLGYLKDPTSSLRWSLRNQMALHNQVTEMLRLHTSDLRGGQDFWKT